jgi:integral membrane protein
VPNIDLKAFRTIALMEAASFLILLVATLIKYTADAPVGVQIMGPVHGALFVAYVGLAVLVRREAGWNIVTTLLVLLGAVLPFGGFVVDRKLVEPKLTRA